MAWNARNVQPSALQPAAACLEHEGEGAAHCASSTRTGEGDSQMAEWISNLDARCQTGTRSHDRRWRPQPQAPRLDEGSSREDGARLPRHMESLRNLMFRGAEEAPPASYFGGEGAAVPGICALPQQVMCSGGITWRSDAFMHGFAGGGFMHAGHGGRSPRRWAESGKYSTFCLLVPWRYVRPSPAFTSEATYKLHGACGGASYRRFLSSYKDLVLGLFSRPLSHPLAGLYRLCACLCC
jgi:hypothetical protein